MRVVARVCHSTMKEGIADVRKTIRFYQDRSTWLSVIQPLRCVSWPQDAYVVLHEHADQVAQGLRLCMNRFQDLREFPILISGLPVTLT
jgi:hypothetical protein